MTFVDRAQRFEAHSSQFVADLRVAQVPRCRDLAIFVVTTDRQTDTARGVITITLPLAHARGVTISTSHDFLVKVVTRYIRYIMISPSINTGLGF